MSGTGDRSPGTTAAVAFVANAPSSAGGGGGGGVFLVGIETASCNLKIVDKNELKP